MNGCHCCQQQGKKNEQEVGTCHFYFFDFLFLSLVTNDNDGDYRGKGNQRGIFDIAAALAATSVEGIQKDRRVFQTENLLLLKMLKNWENFRRFLCDDYLTIVVGGTTLNCFEVL